MVANTAGSNVFLVTLCAGVLFLAGELEGLGMVGKGESEGEGGKLMGRMEGATVWEAGVMWGSCVVLWAVVMGGGRRWMGWVGLGAYVVFLGGEFWVGRGGE